MMNEKYTYNLLVIDDEKGVTSTIYRQLRKKYNVFTANSAGEAIAIMEKENIQLVISDQRMPGMTGLEFFGTIKDKYPDAVKIMLSGYSDLDAIIGAINEGQVFRYISKPWKPEELNNLLAEAVGKYELITKNKRLAQNLEKCDAQLKEIRIAKEKAQEADLLKSAFLANMSHEIRTPMNGILGFTDLLKEPELSGDQKQKYIGIIEKSGARMLNTISDIIDISKIESGQVEISISDINLNKQIDELFEFFLPEAEKKNIQFTITNRIPKQYATIQSDQEKIVAILTNLLKNAIKYTDNGAIEFGVTTSSTSSLSELTSSLSESTTKLNRTTEKVSELDEVEFYVKDTGIGIPADRQKAIFDRFVQADIADTRAFQGSGLGLAISKAYAKMLDGKIWVESEEGVGSQFYFTIPYSKNTNETYEQKDETSKKASSPKKGLKILVVDDEEFVITYLNVVLKEYEKEMLIAKTGIEAVEMCRKNPEIDLVLMDIKLPEIDGYEATRRIRKFNKEVFILAQTAFAQAGDREKAIDAGCNDYISKPIKRARLFEIIDKQFETL